jgi:hypothetical protein
MGFTFETRGENTYLVYRVERGETVDAVGVGMLTNNRIPGLAPLYYTQSDGDIFLKYSVTSKIAVKDLFAGEVNRRRLSGVVSGIAAAADAASEYMLDSSLLVLEPEYIFADVSTLRTLLVCLPVAERAASAPTLRDFIKGLMINARYDMSENCDYVAGVISYLNEGGPFTPSGVKSIVRRYGKRGGRGLAVEEGAHELNERGAKAADVEPAPPMEGGGERRPRAARELPDDGAGQDARAAGVRSEDSKTGCPGGGDRENAMSLPYLLTHYNRENKRLYRSRRRKEKSEAPPAQKTKAPRESARRGPRPPLGEGFAIPGESPPPIASGWDANPARGGGAGGSAVVPQPCRRAPRVDFREAAALTNQTEGEMTVLGLEPPGAAGAARPHLIRVKNSERIEINRQVFRIGKERGYVDYCVSDNSTVSRSHAHIITRGGQYLLLDTNSTNHTFVDGEMIPGGRERVITHGARIRLASEEFEFREYG